MRAVLVGALLALAVGFGAANDDAMLQYVLDLTGTGESKSVSGPTNIFTSPGPDFHEPGNTINTNTQQSNGETQETAKEMEEVKPYGIVEKSALEATSDPAAVDRVATAPAAVATDPVAAAPFAVDPIAPDPAAVNPLAPDPVATAPAAVAADPAAVNPVAPDLIADQTSTINLNIPNGSGNQEENDEKTTSNEIILQTDEETTGSLVKIFYINLDKDMKRKSNMENQAALFPDIEFERIPGITLDEFVSGANKADYERVAKNGECSFTDVEGNAIQTSCMCDLTHRLAYEKIGGEQGDGFYMVTEDDVTFTHDFNAKFGALKRKDIPEDWDMLRIGFAGESAESDRVSQSPWLKVNRRDAHHWYMGAHAVVLTPSKARSFLERQKKEPLSWADSWTGTGNQYVLDTQLVQLHPKLSPLDASSRADPDVPHLEEAKTWQPTQQALMNS